MRLFLSQGARKRLIWRFLRGQDGVGNRNWASCQFTFPKRTFTSKTSKGVAFKQGMIKSPPTHSLIPPLNLNFPIPSRTAVRTLVQSALDENSDKRDRAEMLQTLDSYSHSDSESENESEGEGEGDQPSEKKGGVGSKYSAKYYEGGEGGGSKYSAKYYGGGEGGNSEEDVEDVDESDFLTRQSSLYEQQGEEGWIEGKNWEKSPQKIPLKRTETRSEGDWNKGGGEGSTVQSTRKLAAEYEQEYYNRQGSTQDLRRMRDWEDIKQVVRQLGLNISPKQIGQAFGALKWCKPQKKNPEFEELLRDLADRAVEHAHRLPPFELTTIIHACAKLRFVHDGLLAAWEKELSDAKVLEACTDIDISTIVYACGVLQREISTYRKHLAHSSNFRGFSPKFVQQIGQESIHPLRIEHYSGTMLTNLFYGLGLLKCREEKVMNRILEEATLPAVMRELSEQNLGSFIYSIGVSHHRNDELLKVFLDTAAKNVEGLTPQCLSNIVYALGQLRHKNRALVDPFLKELLNEERMKQFTEQDISNIVFGLGNMKISDRDMLNAIKSELLRADRLEEFSEKGLSSLLHGFSQLNYKDEGLLDAIVAEVTGPKLRTFRPQGLSVSVYSLGLLKYQKVDLLEHLFFEIAQPKRLRRYRDIELTNIFTGLAALRHKDHELIRSLAEEACSPQRIQSLPSMGIASIAHCFANTQFKDRHYIDILCREIRKPVRLKALNEHGLMLTSSAFVRLFHFDREMFSGLLNEVLLPDRQMFVRGNTYADIMFGCLKCEGVEYEKFEEVIALFRDQTRLERMNGFSLGRLLLICGHVGIRDDEFLDTLKKELLDARRRSSLTDMDKRDLGRGLERLGWMDDDLCKLLIYPRNTPNRPQLYPKFPNRGMGSAREMYPDSESTTRENMTSGRGRDRGRWGDDVSVGGRSRSWGPGQRMEVWKREESNSMRERGMINDEWKDSWFGGSRGKVHGHTEGEVERRDRDEDRFNEEDESVGGRRRERDRDNVMLGV